jgi:energy-coupling factor transport system ATP-binding protein
LQELAEVPPAVLGFPLRRKVALAAVYAMRPQALILDEPTGGLDRDSVGEVMGAIADLHAAGHSIILITHDMELVAREAERVVLLQDGRIVLDAEPREAFALVARLGIGELVPPQISRLSRSLATYGLHTPTLTVGEFVLSYARVLAAGGGREEADAC